jgi:hypothetical protein
MARVQGKRMIKDSLGSGLFGAVAATVFSQLLKQTDKIDVNHNEEFGITTVEGRTNDG